MVRLLLPLLALMAACEDGRPATGPNGEPGGPTRFRLVNEGPARVYLHMGGFWLLSRGGQVLQVADSCAVCNCTDTECNVCGPGATPSAVTPIEPGASYRWEWNGRVWYPAGQLQGQTCEQSALLDTGPLTLIVEHGARIRENAALKSTEVEPPFTETRVDFEHTAGVEVEAVIR